MRRTFAAAGFLTVLAWVASSQAAGPGLFGRRVQTPPPSKHAAIGAYGRAVYPKYYWGLHAREFQNLGVPHGDIGIRGNDLPNSGW